LKQNQPNTLNDLKISVYPNPSISWVAFNYFIPYPSSNTRIDIYNLTGQLIQELNINNPKGEVILDTRKMISGIYTYILRTSRTSRSGKISIVH